MEILDMKCAECGKKIADIAGIKEAFINNSLGVLQADGVYAFFLYLASQKNGEIASKAYDLLKQNGVLQVVSENERDELKAIRGNLVNNLDQLLFAKELLERTLIYARYHAKALGEE